MRSLGQHLWLLVLFAFGITFLEATCLPWLRVSAFTPVIIIAFYSRSFLNCLWMALACGLVLDLLGAQQHLGIYAMTYYLSTLILYNQRRYFFEDQITTLPVMTALFSAISTVVVVLALYLLETGIPISWKWIVFDLIIMSLVDAAYAFLCFQVPQILWNQRRVVKDESVAVERPQ